MLACSVCGRTYEDRWRCECGGPLDIADRPLPNGPPPNSAGNDGFAPGRDGLWAFESFLPVPRQVSLGEGFTPLVDAPDWGCSFKLEYVFPTGSFKDRGATTTLSRAAELGVDRVIEDSSGNAGAAIATYAARAGIDTRIYAPSSAKASKLRAIEQTGAEVVRVTGTREDVTDACVEAVEAGDGWYASHAWSPVFYAGTATMAYEIAAQRGWEVPDAVIVPLGHGTLFLGAYRGFRALSDAGWTDRIPRLLAVQAAGYAPIAEKCHGPSDAQNDIADGIKIRSPVREAQILDAIDATDGDAIAIGESAVEEALSRLHRAGFYIEPTSAVAPAALTEYRDRDALETGDDIVVPLTGSGLKT